MLTSADLAHAIERTAGRLRAIRDELNEADARLGDGDTGMTVTRIVEAWHATASTLPADLGAALALLGRECARASGSSLGAVCAIGLGAAAKVARGREAMDRADVESMLLAAVAAITQRSGANAGDKSILDSLLAIHGALEASPQDAPPLATASTAAGAALDAFRPRQSRLGRARMYGAKSEGCDDPGMLAAHRLLEAVAEGNSG